MTILINFTKVLVRVKDREINGKKKTSKYDKTVATFSSRTDNYKSQSVINLQAKHQIHTSI